MSHQRGEGDGSWEGAEEAKSQQDQQHLQQQLQGQTQYPQQQPQWQPHMQLPSQLQQQGQHPLHAGAAAALIPVQAEVLFQAARARQGGHQPLSPEESVAHAHSILGPTSLLYNQRQQEDEQRRRQQQQQQHQLHPYPQHPLAAAAGTSLARLQFQATYGPTYLERLGQQHQQPPFHPTAAAPSIPDHENPFEGLNARQIAEAEADVAEAKKKLREARVKRARLGQTPGPPSTLPARQESFSPPPRSPHSSVGFSSPKSSNAAAKVTSPKPSLKWTTLMDEVYVKAANDWASEFNPKFTKWIAVANACNANDRFRADMPNGEKVTNVQCRSRWKNIQRPKEQRDFTKEEDDIIKQLARPITGLPWDHVAQKIGEVLGLVRTGKQCGDRWNNQLDPTINKEPWRSDEEAMVRDSPEGDWKLLADKMFDKLPPYLNAKTGLKMRRSPDWIKKKWNAPHSSPANKKRGRPDEDEDGGTPPPLMLNRLMVNGASRLVDGLQAYHQQLGLMHLQLSASATAQGPASAPVVAPPPAAALDVAASAASSSSAAASALARAPEAPAANPFGGAPADQFQFSNEELDILSAPYVGPLPNNLLSPHASMEDGDADPTDVVDPTYDAAANAAPAAAAGGAGPNPFLGGHNGPAPMYFGGAGMEDDNQAGAGAGAGAGSSSSSGAGQYYSGSSSFYGGGSGNSGGGGGGGYSGYRRGGGGSGASRYGGGGGAPGGTSMSMLQSLNNAMAQLSVAVSTAAHYCAKCGAALQPAESAGLALSSPNAAAAAAQVEPQTIHDGVCPVGAVAPSSIKEESKADASSEQQPRDSEKPGGGEDSDDEDSDSDDEEFDPDDDDTDEETGDEGDSDLEGDERKLDERSSSSYSSSPSSSSSSLRTNLLTLALFGAVSSRNWKRCDTILARLKALDPAATAAASHVSRLSSSSSSVARSSPAAAVSLGVSSDRSAAAAAPVAAPVAATVATPSAQEDKAAVLLSKSKHLGSAPPTTGDRDACVEGAPGGVPVVMLGTPSMAPAAFEAGPALVPVPAPGFSAEEGQPSLAAAAAAAVETVHVELDLSLTTLSIGGGASRSFDASAAALSGEEPETSNLTGQVRAAAADYLDAQAAAASRKKIREDSLAARSAELARLIQEQESLHARRLQAMSPVAAAATSRGHKLYPGHSHGHAPKHGFGFGMMGRSPQPQQQQTAQGDLAAQAQRLTDQIAQLQREMEEEEAKCGEEEEQPRRTTEPELGLQAQHAPLSLQLETERATMEGRPSSHQQQESHEREAAESSGEGEVAPDPRG